MGTMARRLSLALIIIGLSITPAGVSNDLDVAPAVADMPAYHLGVGKLDGGTGLGNSDSDDPTARMVAQAAAAPGTGTPSAEPEEGEESASELSRKLTNPVSTIWSLSNQFNNFKLANGHWNNNWNFQPVLPIALTKDWNLITRPVMPFYNIVPHETAPGHFERTSGRCLSVWDWEKW